jgi:hypothetical protein
MKIDELLHALRAMLATTVDANAKSAATVPDPRDTAISLMMQAGRIAEIFQGKAAPRTGAARGAAARREQLLATRIAELLESLVALIRPGSGGNTDAVQLATALQVQAGSETNLSGLLTGKTTTHVLVDWENVQPKDTDIVALVPDVTHVWLFHGPNQTRVTAHQKLFGDRATAVPISRTGKNALDFHLSFYLGYLAARHEHARFVVLSNDKGYEPMIEHSIILGMAVSRVGFGAARKSVATKSTRTARAKPSDSGAEPSSGAAKKTARKAAPAKAATPTTTAAKATTKARKTAKSATEAAPVAKKTPAKKVVAKPADQAVKTPRPAPDVNANASKPAKAAPKPPVAAQSGPKKPPNASRWSNPAQAWEHALNGLGKTANKPTRQARLLALIGSLIGTAATDDAVTAILTRLQSEGRVTISDKGAVSYPS